MKNKERPCVNTQQQIKYHKEGIQKSKGGRVQIMGKNYRLCISNK